MTFKRTNRHGFLLGIIDFFTAGLFFLLYMPLGGLQDELAYILNHKIMPYWKAYLLAIPTLFISPLVRMARIAEELKAKALEMGVQATHVLVAYVWVEHLWPPAVWTGCRHAQVFQHTKQSRGCDKP